MDGKMELNTNKAGMQGLDLDHINTIIRDATGEKYQKHQEQKQRVLQGRIDNQKSRMDSLSKAEIAAAETKIAAWIEELEDSRDLTETIIHLDMDAFYAAVEMRDDRSLRCQPMAVGSNSMLSTSNYAARKFGVRAAMPGFIARKLCPNLVIVPTNFDKYTRVSKQVQSVLRDYDLNFTMGSLDEAYLNVTNHLESRTPVNSLERIRYSGACCCRLPYVADLCSQLMENCDKESIVCDKCHEERYVVKDTLQFGASAEALCDEIRFRIEQTTGLTASGGIAANGLLAKVCSDINKPNGQYFLAPNRDVIFTFLETLPVRKVSGIGSVTAALLKAVGIDTCRDLREKLPILSLLHSELSTEFFLRISLGIGSTWTGEKQDRKSISNERTFASTSDKQQLVEITRSLCSALAAEIEEKKLPGGKTVTLKLKLDSFEVRTRASSLLTPVSTAAQLMSRAEPLLLRELPLAIRLIGVRLSNFVDSSSSGSSGVLHKFLRKIKPPDVSPSCCQYTDTAVDTSSANDDNDQCCEVIALEPSTSNTMSLLEGPAVDNGTAVQCPLCNITLPLTSINRHLDVCLTNSSNDSNRKETSGDKTTKKRSLTSEPRVTEMEKERVIKMRRIDTFFS